MPDSGAYYWWVASPGGAVASAPRASVGTGHLAAGSSLAAGDTLYVLDKHTGEVAAVPVASATAPISLKVSDFHPVTTTSPAAPPASPPRTPSASAAAPSEAQDTGGSLGGRIVSWIFGLVVLGAVIWFVKRLVDSRGQVLVSGARKLGVDVPDPTEIAAQGSLPEGIYTPPAERSVDRVPDEALPAAPSVSPSMGSIGVAARPRLVGLDGPSAGQRFDLDPAGMSVGRDSSNQIVIQDPSISRRHATIREDLSGYVIRDEGSANGIYVNGQRVSEQRMRAGDTVQVGRIHFRFEDH